MKKLLLTLFSLLLWSGIPTFAQAPFNTMDSININNINATVLVHGDMWWNPDSTVYEPKCFYPNGSRKNINFASAIWMSGYDAGNNLHVAAQTYRQDGNDYWPGPLDGSDTITYSTSSDWAKIWKIDRRDMDSFFSYRLHTLPNTPLSILTWPAKGNIYARGNGGVALTIPANMAPFIDVDGNGIYDPLAGDYPDFKGEQALWWVFSDNGPTHTQSNGRPLGVEVHAMAYAFRRGTLIDDVVYYDYQVFNKSANDYRNFRMGLWDDINLGYANDDYMLFDSTWRMAVCYNGTNDDGSVAGYPSGCYGIDPPHSAVTMIALPGDVGSTYVPAGSFMYLNNDLSIIGNPVIDSQYSGYMRATLRNGSHLVNDSGVNINYMSMFNSPDTALPTECAASNSYGDRRFVLSSNDFSLNAGSSAHIVLAQLVADSAGGCPSTSFNKIRTVADTAWHRYHSLATPEVNAIWSVNVYPNPAHNELHIDLPVLPSVVDITVYNMLGQKQDVSIIRKGTTYDLTIDRLPAGVYTLWCRNADAQQVRRFVKQ